MYSTKEKIHIFRKLSCPDVVEADLALLHEKAPHLTDFIRFDFAPRKNHEDILFCLLDFCEQDEIIRYRREFFAAADGEGNDSPTDGDGTDNQADGEGNDSPADGDDTDNQADGEGNDSPTDGDGTDNQADGEGNDSPADGDDTDNPTDGEGNESAAENNKTPVVDNSVDNSSEKGSNQSKEPVTPKKKKKNTRK